MRLLITPAIIFIGFFIVGLNNKDAKSPATIIHFATAAEYPPFEYKDHEVLKGFDIDLAELIAHKMGKKAVFDNLPFSSILPALNSRKVDAAISTITITEERKNNFDFSHPYYFDGIAVVFRKKAPIHTLSQFAGKKLVAQLGSTMEVWLKKHAADSAILVMDNNNQAIEALKAGHVDAVLMDGEQGAIFTQKNPSFSYAIIAQSENGYGIACPKNSPLTIEINNILSTLKENGDIEKLKNKWLKNTE
ncbi:substrate-binding periplasmic protein [Legionella brunensis]|uniref:Amino acid ABC transporter substrate-binding protein n=1 Tax=Legionella brunensis TaxID=29422 RepID=A0A0W0SPK7_9GAMM|nr:ABC transporter substrate-binding protein [Legionella brunensis]KTC85145.1 amino acid ABC transporter substrate-binding protein [Legionella brunensis]